MSFPKLRTINIPIVCRIHAITKNFFKEIFLCLAIIATPISVGKGEAIRNPANAGKICL